MDKTRLYLPAKMDCLNIATSFSRLVCDKFSDKNLDSGFYFSAELAVSEAFTNAVKSRGPGNIELISYNQGGGQVILIKDEGKGSDLEPIYAPKFQEHAEGKYGSCLIRSKKWIGSITPSVRVETRLQ